MPGLRPPQPDDSYPDEGIDVVFEFIMLRSFDDGQVINVMTFEQIVTLLENIEDQLDEGELAEEILAQLICHFKRTRGLG